MERDINDRYWEYRRMQRDRERREARKNSYDGQDFFDDLWTEREHPEERRYREETMRKKRRNFDMFSSDPVNWRTPRYDRYEAWILRKHVYGYNPSAPPLNRILVRLFFIYLPLSFFLMSVFLNLFFDVRPNYDFPLEEERKSERGKT